MKTNFTLKSSLMILFLCLGLSSWGQVTLPTTSPYTQNFDVTPGLTGTSYPVGWTSYNGTTLDGTMVVGTSSSNSGSNYNYNQKIGLLGSGSNFLPGSIVLSIANTTSKTGLKISYDVIKIREQSRSNTFNLEISTTSATSGFTAVPGGAYSSGSIAEGISNSYVNLDISTLDNQSSTVWIRWYYSDEDGSGSRDGIALDNVSISWSEAPTGDHTITVTQPIGGEITPGTTGIDNGEDVSFTATAESSCYVFSHWVVDGLNAGNANPYEFTNVTADYEITAVFNPVAPYEITATAGANGSITPNGTVEVNCGADQAFTITPDAGYAIADVLVNGVSVGAVTTYTFENVTEDQAISASFVEFTGPCVEEDFSGIANNNSYGTKTWTGTGGTWTATDAREDQTINGKAITIRNGVLTSPEFTSGVSSITMTTKLPFSDTAGNLVVKVNDIEVGTIPYSSATTTSTISNVNIGGNIIVTVHSSGARVAIDDLEWTCYSSTSPTLTVDPTAITDLNYGEGDGPSDAQSFVVSGENLDGSEVTVSVAAPFEVSTSENTGFTNSLTLPAYDGTDATIWVRLATGQVVGDYNGTVAISGGDADTVNVTVSGSVLAVPVVTEASDLTAQVDVAYSYQIIASDESFSYVISSEALPAGLSLDTETGFISGTPTVAGEFIFGVEATNNIGTSEEGVFILTVAKGVQTLDGFTDLTKYDTDAPFDLPETTQAGLAVSYASSNTAVATVDANIVTIAGLGTTTITATQAGDANWNELEQTITLTVTEAPELYAGNGVFQKITSIADLTDGYYVFAYNGNAMNNILTSGKFGETMITPASGFIVNPDESFVWKIETTDGAKTIWNDEIEKFINYSSSTNFTLVDNTTNDNSKWNVSEDSDNFLISNIATDTRAIIHRSTGVFGAYSTSNIGGTGTEYNTLQLFKLVPSTAWNGMAWSNGDPDTTKVTVLDAPIIVGAAGMTKALIVTENGGITIPSGTSITVQGAVVNHGDFTVEAGGNLIQVDDVENTGDITVEVKAMTEWFGYNMFSSPVAGQAFTDFSSNNGNEVYTYDYANPDGWVSASGGFVEGEGYLFAAPYTGFPQGVLNPFFGEFVGVPHNGAVSVNVAENSFVSLGNPYPSAIDADELLVTNNNIGTLYFWTNTHFYDAVTSAYPGNNYATYTLVGGVGTGEQAEAGGNAFPTPNGAIQTGQGFIAGIATGGTITFDNTMRFATGGTFYKVMEEDKHRLWLSLADQNNELNQILVGYMEGASQGVDTGIDGPMFGYDGSALYSLIENSDTNYVIQGRYPFATADVVPLGFRAIEGGSYTISLANFDGLFAEGQDIFLKDNATQTYHDLKAGAYTFVSEQGVFESRFEVVYQADGGLSTNNPTLDNKWIVYAQDNGFQIETQGFELKEVAVYDMLGRLIYSNQATGTSHTISNIANGVLIVKVITTGNQVLTRKTAK